VLRFVFDKELFTLAFLKEFLILIASFIIIRFFILQLCHSVYVEYVDIHLLRPGMIPAEFVFKDKGTYKKRPFLFFSLVSYLKKPKTMDVYAVGAEGLTEKDCRTLRKLKREGRLKFDHIKIQQILPFAVFLSIGTLVTLIAGGNIFIYLY
jgi:hypothetical protein